MKNLAHDETVRHYVTIALRDEIREVRPDYSEAAVNQVIAASMPAESGELFVTKDVLYRAIKLAATHPHP